MQYRITFDTQAFDTRPCQNKLQHINREREDFAISHKLKLRFHVCDGLWGVLNLGALKCLTELVPRTILDKKRTHTIVDRFLCSGLSCWLIQHREPDMLSVPAWQLPVLRRSEGLSSMSTRLHHDFFRSN